MSVVQRRLQSFLVGNNYIQAQVQKAFIDGVPGCIEHATVLMEALRDARAAKRSICATWLDLANAYGSVRHMFVQFALEWFHVPKNVCEMLFHYYEGIFAFVQNKRWSSAWFPVAIGVPQGCTASTVIFDAAFQLVLDYHTWRVGERKLFFSLRYVEVRLSKPTFADDIVLVTSTPAENQQSCDCMAEALDWTVTMKLKPPKFRALAFKNPGVKELKTKSMTTYSSYDPKIVIGGQAVPFIGNDPDRWFKYLGRLIQDDLGDDRIRTAIDKKLQDWLVLVDNTALNGVQMSSAKVGFDRRTST